MSTYKDKLNWCLANNNRMQKIKPNKKLSQDHLLKAKHNLKASNYNIQGGFSDWGVSQAYYAMYHSLLAILFRLGYESKNHECTINAVEFLIEERMISLDLKDIAFIRTTQQMTTKDAKSLREEFQYGTQTSVDEELLHALLQNSKEFVERVELSLNALSV